MQYNLRPGPFRPFRVVTGPHLLRGNSRSILRATLLLLLLSLWVCLLTAPKGFGQITTVNFNYNGSAQTFTVPAGVTQLTVVAFGAQGGGLSGGNGGKVNAVLTVTPGQTLQINVGGQGQINAPARGFNGGGNQGTVIYLRGSANTPTPAEGGGGGGATDIRVGSFGLPDRILVAGGGGGIGIVAFDLKAGYAGGGITGAGPQTTNPGIGSDGTNVNNNTTFDAGIWGVGGGGGGGYNGGGASGNDGGGGGSSYVESSASSVVHTQGDRTGNGLLTIDYDASRLEVTTPIGTAKACLGSASSNQTFQASGVGLTANLVATAPTGFEISTQATSGFGASVSLSPTSGMVAATTLFVRIPAGATTGTKSGNVTLSSGSIPSVFTAVSGTVYANPTGSQLTPSVNPLNCQQTTVTLSASAVGQSLTYAFSGPGNVVGSSASATRTVSTSGVYSVTITTGDGCTASANTTVNGAPTDGKVTFGIIASASVVCEGTKAVVITPILIADPGSTFQWYCNGSVLAGQATANLTLTSLLPAQSGSYYLISTGLCSSTTNSFSLTVNPTPPATLLFSDGTQVEPNGTNPIITVPASATNFRIVGGVSYRREVILDRINGYEIRETDQNDTGVFPVKTLGLFRLTVTSDQGCIRTVQGELRR